MDKFMEWLKSKNISSHTVAAAAIAASGIIMTDEQVRSFILGLFDHHPKIGSAIMLLAGTILKYSHSSTAPASGPQIVPPKENS